MVWSKFAVGLHVLERDVEAPSAVSDSVVCRPGEHLSAGLNSGR